MVSTPVPRHAPLDTDLERAMTDTTTDTITTPRRLFRAREGRHLGGVCEGLGRYFDLNPAIYRIAFVALALSGGTGILLYLAAWAVMPDEGADDSYAAELLRRHQGHPARLIALALVAFAVVFGLSEARFWPSPGNLWLALALAVAGIAWWRLSERRPATDAEQPAPARHRSGLLPAALGAAFVTLGVLAALDLTGAASIDWQLVLALLVAVTGAIALVGAATGRAVGGVVALGLVLLLMLALGLAVRVPLFAGIGDRTQRPATLADVNSRYRLGIGDLTVDLSSVRLPRGETHVAATVGIGELLVRVPRDASVEIDGRAQGGDVRLLGQEDHGTRVREQVVEHTGSGRVLVLDARVGFGQVRVERG